MNILSDLYTALSTLDIPIETGVFKDEAPERYIVIAVYVQLCRRQTDRPFQFACGARVIFCALTHDPGEVVLDPCQDHLATCFQNAFSNSIKFTAQPRNLLQEVLRHFDINLCQR